MLPGNTKKATEYLDQKVWGAELPHLIDSALIKRPIDERMSEIPSSMLYASNEDPEDTMACGAARADETVKWFAEKAKLSSLLKNGKFDEDAAQQYRANVMSKYTPLLQQMFPK